MVRQTSGGSRFEKVPPGGEFLALNVGRGMMKIPPIRLRLDDPGLWPAWIHQKWGGDEEFLIQGHTKVQAPAWSQDLANFKNATKVNFSTHSKTNLI